MDACIVDGTVGSADAGLAHGTIVSDASVVDGAAPDVGSRRATRAEERDDDPSCHELLPNGLGPRRMYLIALPMQPPVTD
jgi:hypothetical protein